MKKKKLWIIVGVCAALLAAAAAGLLLWRNSDDVIVWGTPTLTVRTPQKRSAGDMTEIVVDVEISSLGDALYPAASMSIAFDPSRLEFLGIREGNVFVPGDEGLQLPAWGCNETVSNSTGLINLMYLDMTGGRYAFRQDLLAEEDNVVLRLAFRLRGSARAGDVCELVVEDAVFAASDETESLAVTTGSLRTKNGKIVVGE